MVFTLEQSKFHYIYIYIDADKAVFKNSISGKIHFNTVLYRAGVGPASYSTLNNKIQPIKSKGRPSGLR